MTEAYSPVAPSCSTGVTYEIEEGRRRETTVIATGVPEAVAGLKRQTRKDVLLIGNSGLAATTSDLVLLATDDWSGARCPLHERELVRQLPTDLETLGPAGR